MSAEYLTCEDLPQFYKAADKASTDGQERYLSLNKLHLAALIGAALLGIMTQVVGKWAGILAGICFVGAAILRLYMGKVRDDRTWYEGRAAAESAKTLAWRYAVKGRPFTSNLPPSDARSHFVQQLSEVSGAVEHLALSPQLAPHGEIGNKMEQLRAAPLMERMEAYKAGRLQDQQAWYAKKAEENNRAGRRWEEGLVSLEFVGAAIAVGFGTGWIQVDLLGVISASGAAALAWKGIRQHDITATAYSVASNELAQILTYSTAEMDESRWAGFVDQSEEAISREHTLWVASRGVFPLR